MGMRASKQALTEEIQGIEGRVRSIMSGAVERSRTLKEIYIRESDRDVESRRLTGSISG